MTSVHIFSVAAFGPTIFTPLIPHTVLPIFFVSSSPSSLEKWEKRWQPLKDPWEKGDGAETDMKLKEEVEDEGE